MVLQNTETATGLSEAIRNRQQTVVDTLEQYLTRIAAENDRHHAYRSVFVDEARLQARKLDAELAAGIWRGPLHGMPVAVKDNIDIVGQRAAAGSVVRRVEPAREDAEAIKRLRLAGAIVLGHTHMVEFAFGGWGTNTASGTPRNPLDALRHRVPGGSSSGSAVAVAASLAPLALGTDTGGSVRIPAAMNGLTGFKPTWGLVPDTGLTTLCSRFDVIGPMGRTVADCWALFDALTAKPGAAHRPLPTMERPLRIGVVDPVAYGSYCTRVLDAFHETCDLLSAQGLQLEPFVLPINVDEVLARTACLIGHEAVTAFGDTLVNDSGNLDRGVSYRLNDARRFTPTDYEREWEVRAAKCKEMVAAMAGFDALLFPTTPILPPPVDEIIERAMPLGDLTRVVNYLDLCAMALPTATTPEGLRHSIQVIGAHGDDALVFALSAKIEHMLASAYGDE